MILKTIRRFSASWKVHFKEGIAVSCWSGALPVSCASIRRYKTKLLISVTALVLVMACVPSIVTPSIPTIDPGAVNTSIVQTAAVALAQTATARPPATATPTPPPNEFHIAVNGNDSNPGTADKPFATIERARDVIRTRSQNMQGPITTYIHGGTYFVGEPIEFTVADSGQNGFDIVYRAAENEVPVFSGGIKVRDWEYLPESHMWKAVLPDVKGFRQLYVNGVRAQRAASQEPVTGKRWAAGNYSSKDGIVVWSAELPNLARPQDLELHWVCDWKDVRLLVQGIEQGANDKKTIWMAQPWYSYALSMEHKEDNDRSGIPAYDIPFYLENALELLDEPGEWYFNPDTHELFYMPRDGEDVHAAIIPQTQTLIEIRGDKVGGEVHNLVFDGLSFAYAGWTRASERGTFGYQAQDLMVTPGWCDKCQEMTPAHVELNFARDIRFERCRFEHMGAVGLGLNNDVYRVTVKGNLFYDLSDGAIVVGHWEHAYINHPSLEDTAHDNLIANNLIEKVGVEYWGAPAITAYYVKNLQITHNEISNVPYSGISIGWGWSSLRTSGAAYNNAVTYNLITDVTQRARDGGGIYTLGKQPGTVIEGNVVRRVNKDHACFYTDEGSEFITFQNNVCDTAPRWLFIGANTIHNIDVFNTYTNVSRMANKGTSIQIGNTIHINEQNWTPEAQVILSNAGLESAYSYLRDWLQK